MSQTSKRFWFSPKQRESVMVCEKQQLLKFRLACFHEFTHFKMLLDVYYNCEQTIAKDKHFLHNVSYIVLSRFHLNTLAAPAESWRLFACITQRQIDRRTELNTKSITHIVSMCHERAAYHRACQIPTSAHIPQVTSRTLREPAHIPDVTS